MLAENLLNSRDYHIILAKSAAQKLGSIPRLEKQ
ncbi:hypothetical protein PCC7424_3642 [Gloeothece citriformis PCC 7424]|uniref:Uncharacterized protein n=1 Tax=Gloeothece citriformis (strain PCC 7424) TaxID=65393 RepID=B7KHS9_GLOC7|nr:hypothetical protein PCC7424_3642 [Gloeothece citriformis PCC 7424]